MIKILKYLFEACFVYLFYIIGKLLGLNLSRKIFSYIFVYLAPFFKSKKVLYKNLEIFNKNLSHNEKKLIIKSMWKNYGMTFIEYIFLNYFRKNNEHVEIIGENILKDIIIKKEKVIFISGHFANFELMSMEITKKGIDLAAIYRPLNNYFLNPFMEHVRRKYVCQNQIKKGVQGVKRALEYLNKNFSIALMIDQRVSEGEKIEFFGKKAFTTTLPAQLALKYNLQIIPVFIERKDDNNFKIEFFKGIKASDFENKFKLTKKLNEILENMIIKKPTHWIWSHDRWK